MKREAARMDERVAQFVEEKAKLKNKIKNLTEQLVRNYFTSIPPCSVTHLDTTKLDTLHLK